MDTFRWIAVVLSTVLGLGVARVLMGYVSLFKARHRVRFDWLPLVLAATVLCELFQFWWAIAELATVKTWSLADFMLLIALVGLLFVGAALIMPSDSELAEGRNTFEHDGRFALIALSLYHALCIAANWWLFGHVRPAVTANLAAMTLLALAIGLVTRRRLQEGAAVVYVALTAADTLLASVLVYRG